MSIWIAAVAAVKLFKIEEQKESLAAAGGRRPCEAAAASDSFSSSTLKSFPAATASIMMELAFAAGVAGGNESFDSRSFYNPTHALQAVTSLVSAGATFRQKFREQSGQESRSGGLSPSNGWGNFEGE